MIGMTLSVEKGHDSFSMKELSRCSWSWMHRDAEIQPSFPAASNGESTVKH